MNTKKQVKKLWKLCFDDSDEFIDLYFRLRYNKDINVVIESGNQVVSALQMIPYPMTFLGKEIQTSYISGACTHPDYRGRGVMRELLSQSLARMAKGNIPVSTLIPAEPWLFDYYERMGYASVFNYSEYHKKTEDITLSGKIKLRDSTQFDKEIYRYLADGIANRPCCIQHTESDFKTVLADLALSGGVVTGAYQGEAITGVILAQPEGENLIVKELLANTPEIENHLLRKAALTYDCKTVSILRPATHNEPGHRLGMARIIHAKPMLQLYAAAYPKEDMNIELTDEQLSFNNGYYSITGGRCMFSKTKLPGTHTRLNMGELTGKIFMQENPYMSLMLD